MQGIIHKPLDEDAIRAVILERNSVVAAAARALGAAGSPGRHAGLE